MGLGRGRETCSDTFQLAFQADVLSVCRTSCIAWQLKGVRSPCVKKIMLSHGWGLLDSPDACPQDFWRHRTPTNPHLPPQQPGGPGCVSGGDDQQEPHTACRDMETTSASCTGGSTMSACTSGRSRKHWQAWPMSLAPPCDILCRLTQQANWRPSPGSQGAHGDDEDRRKDAEEACVPDAWGMCQRKLQQHGH